MSVTQICSPGRPCGDIESREDIEELLSCFYRRAFADPLIGSVFTNVARLDLATHLQYVSDFWEVALLRTGRYRRNAFVVHQRLHNQQQLSPAHFARWLEIWTAAVDSLYTGVVAEHAKSQGERIAHSMSKRLNA